MNFFKGYYTIQWTLSYFLFLPFLEDITGFSGCFIAFIVKKLLFLLKKKETIKVKGGKAVIFFKAQGKTWITLPLLTKKDNTVLSECLLHLSEKSHATQFPQSWHLKAVLCLFCNLNKTFFKQGKKKMKVFSPDQTSSWGHFLQLSPKWHKHSAHCPFPEASSALPPALHVPIRSSLLMLEFLQKFCSLQDITVN